MNLSSKKNKALKITWPLFVTLFMLGTMLTISSCKKDDPEPPEVIASFQFASDATDWKQVAFTNYSEFATSYSWDFGDMESSTEENPVHIYAAAGTYTVKLIATGDGGIAEISKDVTIIDPLAAQRALVGDNGKDWMLIADVSTGVYPYMIVPAARNDIWWAFGGQHDYDPLCVRYSVFDDVWTFNTDGTFDFANNGDFWGDYGVWPDDQVMNFDATVAANWTGKDGQDLSGWDSGTNNFVYNPSTNKLTVTGGFVGLCKVGSTSEVTEPQATVEYTVVKLVDVDNGVDTLVIETQVVDPTSGVTTAYWISTLVSYDNVGDIIVIEECPAVENVDVTFKLNFNTYAGTASTPYISGTFNSWSGDANPMTDADADGIWEVTLTLDASTDYEYKFSADNWADQESLTEGMSCTVTNGGNTNRNLSTGTSDMTVGPVCWNSCENCPVSFTASDIEGDWTLEPVAGAMGVGATSGDISWWSNSLDDATTTRACLFDDVYTFVNGGTFSYAQDGSTWVEMWQGAAADGCAAPVAPHDGSGSYTFEATSTTVKVIGQGAFLALAKAYNGGELAAGTTVPDDRTYTVTDYSVAGDGTKRLTVEIDVSGAFWTYKLISVPSTK